MRPFVNFRDAEEILSMRQKSKLKQKLNSFPWTFAQESHASVLDFRAGIKNLQDTQYSSFFRLNANNGRYFNPQAGRTFYGGLRFTFTKEHQLIR